MTARKRVPARRVAPPGWCFLQDAANLFGISVNTMSKWVALGFVRTGHPDGTRALVSEDEARRIQRLLEQQIAATAIVSASLTTCARSVIFSGLAIRLLLSLLPGGGHVRAALAPTPVTPPCFV